MGIDLRVFARHIFEHRLVEFHLPYAERQRERAERQHHDGKQKRRERDGHGMQGQIDDRRRRGAQRETHVSLVRGHGCEAALPKHVHTRASDAEEDGSGDDELERERRHVHGRDDGRGSYEDERSHQSDEHAPRRLGDEVRPYGAYDVGREVCERLRKVEEDRDIVGLEALRQEGEDAAPYLGRVDGDEYRESDA